MQRDFKLLKVAVQTQFQKMLHHPLFRVHLDKDALWRCYLDMFPPGTNQLFRERREYDCTCCRHFVRNVGDTVAIVDNKVVTLWDVACEDAVYQHVADRMANYVKAHAVGSIFLHTERTVGTDCSLEQRVDREVVRWQHFFMNLPPAVVVRNNDLGPKLSEARAHHDVLLRSLLEITPGAVDTVLDLISQGSLYRGTEQRGAVEQFQRLQIVAGGLDSDNERDLFAWTHSIKAPANVAKIRNTAIGTLLVDLSEGMEVEPAVQRFETVMAPANYKRPTALVTLKMVAAAKETLTDLGLVSALDRRYARLTDLTINNLLFMDHSARKAITSDVFDELSTRANPASRQTAKVDEVTIDVFIRSVLPRVTTVEVCLENRLSPHLVSLVTGVDPTARQLFKWNNPFSWSYRGDFADSIKERVKAAGGNVTGELLCRLSWYNTDDLDLHMVEPSGYEIYFANRQSVSPAGGRLDVDMNVNGETRTPVENIFYGDRRKMTEGVYQLIVHQYNQRESKDVGFEVEFEYLGETTSYVYDMAVKHREAVTVVRFNYSHRGGVEVLTSLPPSQKSKVLWGLATQQFHRVTALMRSPNHWDGRATGNQHYFFMLDGCRNDETARGFYNEFLNNELTPHRKVIEMVGARMRTDDTTNQLSGLGFSDTQRQHALVRVTGAYTRTLKVLF